MSYEEYCPTNVLVGWSYSRKHVLDEIKAKWENPLRYAVPVTTNDTEVANDQIAVEFRELVEKWRNETGHISSIPDLVMHSSYQKILRMPKAEVIPLILRELRDNGGFWFPALNAITDENPVNPNHRGNVKKMTEDWLAWGRHEGWHL